ncbi:hypothetical protein PHLGIDRAFT_409595 [Phlebiopsis gigantea 11061_1 CR5-6]|uniref:Major facilitator superfamily (MFS) profile domain-containing protein n=1 Tax=Phlebiopsis gigantea (strain 11061_1 CR5-6) TaxID=745531 RepID=A0A0C3NR66_PHLG1|nr:hypothetical protein PHLGIDRAFT_409595 [Phlebiopsis gigantea 11061_1 CR5-6]
MQIPSNMFLSRISRPSLYLPMCMIVWGFLSLLTGCANNFTQVLLTRVILGIVEASFFPGAVFLISRWYKHDELGMRTAILVCGVIFSNAFGALLASAILDSMQGVLGFAAWRWLFFVEGTTTIIVATSAVYILPDFPETTRPGWLTEEEVRLAVRRMQENADMSEDYGVDTKGISDGFWLAISDPNTWILTMTQFFLTLSGGFTDWFPTIMSTLGYNPTITLLLCAPPYLLTTVITFIAARHSDMTRERCKHITVPLWITLIGLLIAMSTMSTTARYFSFSLLTVSYTGCAIFLGWQSNIFPSPPVKRAVALAFINAVSNVGNIFGSYIWQPSWAPTYRASLAICAISTCAAIASVHYVKRRLVKMNNTLHQAELDKGESTVGFRYLT